MSTKAVVTVMQKNDAAADALLRAHYFSSAPVEASQPSNRAQDFLVF